MTFKNKVVLVTGASSGIGAATAKLFAKDGADVAIVARNQDKLNNVATECAKFGNKPLVIKADITNDSDVKTVVEETVAKFGKIDVLVNNAGIVKVDGIFDGTFLNGYDELMNINIDAVVRLTILAAPHLIKTKGNIVNVSSVAATVAIAQHGAYCMSKAALNQFSRVAALELAPFGVRVNIVSPGPVDTKVYENAGVTSMTGEQFKSSTALNRISKAEEVGDLILFLASDKAKGITGSEYILDNGMVLKL